MQVRAEIAYQQIELSIAVVINDGYLRPNARPRLLAHIKQLAVANSLVLGNQSDGCGKARLFLRADVAIPIDASVRAAGDNVPKAIAVPVHDHRIGVFAPRHARKKSPGPVMRVAK